MAGFLKPSPSLTKLMREPQNLADIIFMIRAHVHDTIDDRGLAILETADLDRILERALVSKLVALNTDQFRELFGSDAAPLGTLSAKTKIGWAMGLFGTTTRNELDRIRHIRNVFAHAAKPIYFSEPAIKEQCAKLVTPGRIARPKDFKSDDAWPPTEPRIQFSRTAQELRTALSAVVTPGLEELLGRSPVELD